MLQNGFWAWLSPSYPAGRYTDVTITKLHLKEIQKCISKDERILVDLAWSSEEMKNTNLFVFGHKRIPGGQLSERQNLENEVLGHFRGN